MHILSAGKAQMRVSFQKAQIHISFHFFCESTNAHFLQQSMNKQIFWKSVKVQILQFSNVFYFCLEYQPHSRSQASVYKMEDV
jgi:hypothetical protein